MCEVVVVNVVFVNIVRCALLRTRIVCVFSTVVVVAAPYERLRVLYCARRHLHEYFTRIANIARKIVVQVSLIRGCF